MAMKADVLVGSLVIIALVGYLAYLGASNPWQYYLLVDECYEQVEQLQGKHLRVSGRVANDSLSISAERRNASFSLEGKAHKFAVTCAGPLPDNLKEGIEVVVEGRLQGESQLQGDKVITRCASKYAPKEASDAAENSPTSPPR